jgi:hypothetical protein
VVAAIVEHSRYQPSPSAVIVSEQLVTSETTPLAFEPLATVNDYSGHPRRDNATATGPGDAATASAPLAAWKLERVRGDASTWVKPRD